MWTLSWLLFSFVFVTMFSVYNWICHSWTWMIKVCSGLSPEFNVQAKTWLLQLKKGGNLLLYKTTEYRVCWDYSKIHHTHRRHIASDLKQSIGFMDILHVLPVLLHALSTQCAIKPHSALLSNTTPPLDMVTCATDNFEPHPSVMQFVVRWCSSAFVLRKTF